MASKALMVQGTNSNAGKSVLVTGLCRLFKRHGYRVAPFKPQNMALNSAVTLGGGEIGRSQAVQALAAGVEIQTDMNPILLKPNSDKGSQVIINGKAQGNMDAVEYHAFKKEALPYAIEAFHRLTKAFDIVLVEGAGSPAEINLRENDIANMGFATVVDCPVLLCADIDRGGVFAHLVGTMDCLDASEQALIKGFIINRFRGDQTLLNSGIDWLRQTTGIGTLGVLPYLKGLHIEAEDAVDKRDVKGVEDNDRFIVVVPSLPRISNHTDFDVLRLHPDVELIYVEQGQSIPPSDLVILPGSKSTISDLHWLIDNEWVPYLQRHLRYGGKLMGICAGFQMIGSKLHDPLGIEGMPGSCDGLGFMSFETTIEPYKQLSRVKGNFAAWNAQVEGYEIHMGKTQGDDLLQPAIQLSDKCDGTISSDNQILCTYLHGVFDNPEACQSLLTWAGGNQVRSIDYAGLREQAFDRVADMLEAEVGFDRLLDCVGPII